MRKIEVLLYTTGCPLCEALEKKFKDADVSYDICDDVDTMMDLGMTHVPMLRVGDKMMDYREAMEWIAAQDGGN